MDNTEKLVILKSKDEVEKFRKTFQYLNIPDFCNLTFLTNKSGEHIDTGYVLKLSINDKKINSLKFAPTAVINNYFNLDEFLKKY